MNEEEFVALNRSDEGDRVECEAMIGQLREIHAFVNSLVGSQRLL